MNKKQKNAWKYHPDPGNHRKYLPFYEKNMKIGTFTEYELFD